MKHAVIKPRQRKGRPRSFNRDAAVHQAMLLFWRHGYEATSLSHLTAALGVSPPSIYAAFGDKKTLFLEAVGRYVGNPMTASSIIASARTARDAALTLLTVSAIGFTGADSPPGCLLATAAISCSPAADDVQRTLAEIRVTIEQQLASRIAHDVEVGALPREVDGETLAAHVMAVIQGMSTLARDGASQEKLLRVCETAMSAWPATARRNPHLTR
jgi:AcrR family transcriptional regulator